MGRFEEHMSTFEELYEMVKEPEKLRGRKVVTEIEDIEFVEEFKLRTPRFGRDTMQNVIFLYTPYGRVMLRGSGFTVLEDEEKGIKFVAIKNRYKAQLSLANPNSKLRKFYEIYRKLPHTGMKIVITFNERGLPVLYLEQDALEIIKKESKKKRVKEVRTKKKEEEVSEEEIEEWFKEEE